MLRADSDSARDALMSWCEREQVHFIFGLAKNERLTAELQPWMGQARAECERTGKAA